MLLLLQRIFREDPVLMQLYGRFSCFKGRLNFRSLWFSFRWFTMRNFSEGPPLSIGPFQKVQREVIYLPYRVRKNE